MQLTILLLGTTLGAILVFLFQTWKSKRQSYVIPLSPQLNGNDAQYRDLINNFSGVIFSTNLQGIIDFSSPGVLNLTGYTPEDVIGKHYSLFLDPESQNLLLNHYRHQLINHTKETACEFCIITRDGQKKWVEQVAILAYQDDKVSGFQCFVRDISEKKAMQLELEEYEFRLKENQLLLQSILDNTNSVIYVKDLSGRYLIANRRFINVLEYPENAVLGHTDYELTSKEQADHYKAIDDQVLQTGHSIEIEEKIQTKKGPIHLLLTKFPLRDNDNNILGISGIATDITERVQYQQALIAARIEAEDARKMQEQFLANMSHEIRTPMNGIQGMTNLLQDTPLTTQQQEFVSIIRRSVDNLLVIINDILDFSKIKAGKLTIEKIDFRLQDVIANVRGLFEQRLDKKKLDFQTYIDPHIPEWIQGDPHRLNQVLINLIGNAIKFTEKGTIRLSVQLATQQASSITLGFTVSDEGIGIPKEKLPFLFDSFSQAGLDISRKYGGTGLGLAICQQLLSLQHGSISVSSREGIGTNFHFHIPYGCEPPVNHTRTAAAPVWNYEGFLDGLSFLVVEDNPVNQKVTEHVLRKAGALVAIAENGQEAIELLKTRSYDLIIMDLQMPIMDGYETTRYLRSNLQLQTPILAMTANAIKGEHIRCMEAGMNDYMSKPFEFKDFYTRIAALLQKPGAIPAAAAPAKKKLEYSLSLLEEVGDEGYVQDILNTFLSVLPGQMKELSIADQAKDYDRIFFIAHKLKGSAGMIQAPELTERLSAIEKRSHEKADASDLVQEVIALFDQLLGELKILITTESNTHENISR